MSSPAEGTEATEPTPPPASTDAAPEAAAPPTAAAAAEPVAASSDQHQPADQPQSSSADEAKQTDPSPAAAPAAPAEATAEAERPSVASPRPDDMPADPVDIDYPTVSLRASPPPSQSGVQNAPAEPVSIEEAWRSKEEEQRNRAIKAEQMLHDLNQKLAHSEVNDVDTQKQLKNALETNAELKREVEHLKELATRAEAGESEEIASLKKALEAANADAALQKARCAELSAKVDKLESELSLQSKMVELTTERLTKEKEDALAQLRVSFHDISEKQKEAFMKLKAKLQEGAAIHKQMYNKNVEKTKQVTDLLDEKDELNSKVETLTARLKEREQQLAAREAELSAAQAQLKAAKDRLMQLEAADQASKIIAQQLEETKKSLEDKERKIDEQDRVIMKEALRKTMECYIEAEGDLVNGSLVRVRVMFQGEFKVQWNRSFYGSSFEPIQGATKETYMLSADDIGAVVQARCVSVETGFAATSEVGPVEIEPKLEEEVKRLLESTNEHTFTVHAWLPNTPQNKVPSSFERTILLTHKNLKIREGRNTKAKAVYNKDLKISLDTEDTTKFNLQVDENKIAFAYRAANNRQRDLIAVSIRAYSVLRMHQEQQGSKVWYVKFLIHEANASSMQKSDEPNLTFDQKLAAAQAAQAAFEAEHSRGGGGGGGAGGKSESQADEKEDGGELKAYGYEDPGDSPKSKKKGKADDEVKATGANDKQQVRYDADGFIIREETAGWGDKEEDKKAHDSDSEPEADAPPPIFAKVVIKPAEQAVEKPTGDKLRQAFASLGALKPPGGDGDAKPTASRRRGVTTMQVKKKVARPGLGDLLEERHSALDLAKAENGSDGTQDSNTNTGSAATTPSAAGGTAAPAFPALERSTSNSSDMAAGAGGRLSASSVNTNRSLKSPRSAASTPLGNAAPTLAAPVSPRSAGGASAAAAAAPASAAVDDEFAAVFGGGDSKPKPKTKPKLPPPLNATHLPAASSTSSPRPAPTTTAAPAPAPAAKSGSASNLGFGMGLGPLELPSADSSDVDVNAILSELEAHKRKKGDIPSSAPGGGGGGGGGNGSGVGISSAKDENMDVELVSSKASGAGGNHTDVEVVETVHSRMKDGVVGDFAIYGEVNVKFNPPPNQTTSVQFRVDNVGSIGRIQPNPQAVTSPGNGIYLVTVPAGTGEVCALKYKMSNQPNAPKPVPLRLTLKWGLQPVSTSVDVEYTVERKLSKPLSQVKFLISMAPKGAVNACVFAHPQCLWNQQQQKLMWKLPALPVQQQDGSLAFSGRLHARLDTKEQCVPSPLRVSFASTDLDAVLSGIKLLPLDNKASGDVVLSKIDNVVYCVKSGVFTAE